MLGEAEEYQVAIHWQGGQRLYTPVEGVVEGTWGRKLDDDSQGSIVVAKADASAQCCGRLGNVHTWAHELSIWRDGEFVWQGPITQKSEFKDRFEFQARDVIAWFDQRENPIPYNWSVPDDQQNTGGWGLADAGVICNALLGDAFHVTTDPTGSGHFVSAQHDPNLWPHLVVLPSGVLTSYQALQPHHEPLGDAIRSLIGHGLDMATVGRDVFIVPEHVARSNTPHRLSDRDFLGDLEVREAGTDAATRAIVEGGQPQAAAGQPAPGAPVTPAPAVQQPPPVGIWPPIGGENDPALDKYFGLLITHGSSQDATTQAAVDALAKSAWSYAYPPPVSIVVPPNTQLSPDADISIRELVPARRVAIRLDTHCTPVENQFVINEVEVKFAVSSGVATEQVQVSLTSQGSPLGDTPKEAT